MATQTLKTLLIGPNVFPNTEISRLQNLAENTKKKGLISFNGDYCNWLQLQFGANSPELQRHSRWFTLCGVFKKMEGMATEVH